MAEEPSRLHGGSLCDAAGTMQSNLCWSVGGFVDSIDAALAKHAKAHESYAKAMEMIGVTSAGAIAVVVALRPAGDIASLELRAAMVFLFSSTIGVIFWFMSKGAQYNLMAQKILRSPNSEYSAKEPWWGRAG